MRLTVALILALVVAVGAGLYAAQKAWQYHRTAENLASQLEAAEAQVGVFNRGSRLSRPGPLPWNERCEVR